ncbi:MAG: YidC/Oxa1 family membrane protein insertase [Dehalococcoidia bacterium]
MPIGEIWQTLLETPFINFLVALSVLTFGSYGLAILAFTVISRVVTFPLTLRTLRATRKMQEVQPLLQEIQKKYSDPKRRTEETMRLYREQGVNPLGCLGPQLIQFPLFIALYQVIRITLGGTPESMLYLETRLYDVNFIKDAIPLSRSFLGIDLGAQGNIPLVVIVVSGMWLQQRISTSRNAAGASAQQQQMNQTMQWMMPLMFGWFSFVVPAGLALYWSATTIIGIVLQWIFVGPGDFTWGSLVPNIVRDALGMQPAASRPAHQPTRSSAVGGDISATDSAEPSESGSDNGTGRRSQRSRRRGSDRQGPPSAGGGSGRSRRRRRPRG